MTKIKVAMLLVVGLLAYAAKAQDQLKKKSGITLEVKVEKLNKQEVTYTIGTDGKQRTIGTSELSWVKLASEPDTIWYERPVVTTPLPAPQKVEDKSKTVVSQTTTTDEIPLPAGVRLATDSDNEVYIRYDGKRVVLADSMVPLAKESMIDFGIGNMHPIGQFGDKTGNILAPNYGSGHAGLGFMVHGSIDIRFSKHFGGNLFGQIAGNSLDNSQMAAGAVAFDGQKPTSVSGNGPYLNYAIGIGPTFYYPLSKYVDLMVQTGLGLSSHQNPSYTATYDTGIVGGGPRTEYSYSSNASTGFLLYGMAKFRCYIYKNVFAIATVGYSQLQTRISYAVTVSRPGTPANSDNLAFQRIQQNLSYGIGLGYGF